MKFLATIGILVSALVGTAVQAETKPRWMSPEAGYIDSETDTRVEEVSAQNPDGSYSLTLSVPRVNKEIEEVVVVGQSPERPDQPSSVRWQLTNDPDSNRSGIILYLGQKQDFAVHINYDDGSRMTVPATASNPGAALQSKR